MYTTDLIIVGAGPAGIFTALELIRKGSKKRLFLSKKGSRLKNGIAQKPQQNIVSTVNPTAILQPVFPAQAHFLTESFP